MSLYPTPTRLALLDQVRVEHVYWHPDGTSHVSGGGQVTARIAEMEAAGWVHLPGDLGVYDVRYWQLTDAGRKVLDEQAATRYQVVFERIGRSRGVAPFGPVVSGPDHAGRLAEEIHRYAGRHLSSRFFDVSVDLDAGKGWIEGGRFGTFTVTRVGAA